ncbi:MAG: radical SAM protein, partial [candidate division Zixibacteria bacterium]|nr:radical SAM protein [candidate division Zixibacteria bacterium]
MKASRFNLFFTYDDGTILGYNSRTQSLIECDRKEYQTYEEWSAGSIPNGLNEQECEQLNSELAKGGFLVEDNADELAQIRAQHNIARFMQRSVGLTIGITHDCNLACTYCYEERSDDYLGEPEIPLMLQLTQRLLDRSQANRLTVTWYGGEPLLNTRFLYAMSKRLQDLCSKRGIQYASGIVTNGTLLTRRTARTLLKHQVTSAQVTLDGPSEINDARRMYRNGKGSFNDIVQNIKQTCDLLKINIRVNVDTRNVGTAKELLDVLEREGIKEKVLVYFAPVNSLTAKCKTFVGHLYRRRDFASIEVSLLAETLERGFRIDKSICLPRTMSMGCSMLSPYSLAIDAKKQIQKCWMTLCNSDEAVGMLCAPQPEDKKTVEIDLITSRTTNSQIENMCKWMAHDPFSFSKCRQCSLLPSCMGSCPWVVVGLGRDPECPTWKANIRE